MALTNKDRKSFRKQIQKGKDKLQGFVKIATSWRKPKAVNILKNGGVTIRSSDVTLEGQTTLNLIRGRFKVKNVETLDHRIDLCFLYSDEQKISTELDEKGRKDRDFDQNIEFRGIFKC